MGTKLRLANVLLTAFVLAEVGFLLAALLPTEPLPESFRAPAVIRWFFGHPWWAVGLLTAFFVYAVMFCLAGAWHGVFRTSQWRAFNLADGIAIPILFSVFGLGFEHWEGSSSFYASSGWSWMAMALGLLASAANAANDARNAGGWRKAFDSPYAVYHAAMLGAFICFGLLGASVVVAVSWPLTAVAVVAFVVYAAAPALDARDKSTGARPIPGRGWGW